MNYKYMLLLMTVLLLAVPLQSHAQTPSLNQPVNMASRYFLGDTDEILIKVNILGFIRKPGQYFIPRHTDLVTLIANAGGFIKGADLNKIQLMRQPLKADNRQAIKHKIKYISLKKYFETGNTANLPMLQAGDAIVINRSRGDKIRSFFGANSVFNVVATLASVVLIIDRIRYN